MGSVLEENIQMSFDRLTRRSFVRLGGLGSLGLGLSQLLEGRSAQPSGVLVVPVAVSSSTCGEVPVISIFLI